MEISYIEIFQACVHTIATLESLAVYGFQVMAGNTFLANS